METPQGIIKPKDIIDIVSRRRWYLIFPMFAAVLAGICLAFTLPKVYEAKTLILVQSQKVPTDYVRSVITDDVESRLSTISQQIMSRTNLERVIQQFNLFSGPKSKDIFLEDKLESLRKRISVDVTRQGRRADADAFSISFKGGDPHQVMQVVNELTRYFIDTNMKVRESQALGTSDFLKGELQKMKLQLDTMEAALKEFRQRHMGELPEQLTSNLAILQRLQEQLNAKQDSLRDTGFGLSMIEKQIAEGRRTATIPGATGRTGGAPTAGIVNNPEILRQQLAELRTRYTERHPDVTRLKKKIAELEAANHAGTAPGEDEGKSPSHYNRDPIAEQRAELMRSRVDIEAEIADLLKQIKKYQQRVENTPKREQEFLSIKRDYDNVKEVYNSLLNRKMEAEMSVSMERKQKGEQFYILDHAKLPQKPIAPNMKKLLLITLVAGLGLGGGLAYLLEYLDTSYRKPEEIEASLRLPVIATIPPVYQRKEIKRMRRLSGLSYLFTGFVVVLLGIFAFVTLNGTDQTIELIRRYIPL